jgi:hypothetical protein
VLLAILASDPARCRFEDNSRERHAGGTMSTLREQQFEERSLSDQEFEDLLLKTWEYMCNEENDVPTAHSATEAPPLA